MNALLLVLGSMLQDTFVAKPRVGDSPWLEGPPAHGTADIRRLLPGVQFVFLETEHFRIACALSACKPPNERRARQRLEQELRVLAAWGIKPARGVLDPATRAHLFALRCEQVYGDILRMLEVRDAEFPRQAPPNKVGRYLGEGPFLGMPHRFTVMLCQQESALSAYVGAYARRHPSAAGIRHLFQHAGSLFVGVAAEGPEVAPLDDSTLHATLVYNLVHVLVDAWKYPWHDTPFWLQEGLAHWFRRRIRPDHEVFTCQPTQVPAGAARGDWERLARSLANAGGVTPLHRTMLWLEDRSVAYADHVAMWSRVDFLLTRHPRAFAVLLRQVKGPETRGESFTPTPQRLVERQVDALAEVLGSTPDQLDAAWREHLRM
jgi:hypothetical protein